MTWIQTVHGRPIDLLTPDLSLMTIDEIAHALARIGRFSGHTQSQFAYSVAQHSVLVAMHVPAEDRLAALMHDAHEAILGDWTTPVKQALKELGGWAALKSLEGLVIGAVRARWGLGDLPRSVKCSDLQALVTERRDLLGAEARPWDVTFEGRPVEPWDDCQIEAWGPSRSSEDFLDCFEAFGGRP